LENGSITDELAGAVTGTWDLSDESSAAVLTLSWGTHEPNPYVQTLNLHSDGHFRSKAEGTTEKFFNIQREQDSREYQRRARLPTALTAAELTSEQQRKLDGWKDQMLSFIAARGGETHVANLTNPNVGGFAKPIELEGVIGSRAKLGPGSMTLTSVLQDDARFVVAGGKVRRGSGMRVVGGGLDDLSLSSPEGSPTHLAVNFPVGKPFLPPLRECTDLTFPGEWQICKFVKCNRGDECKFPHTELEKQAWEQERANTYPDTLKPRSWTFLFMDSLDKEETLESDLRLCPKGRACVDNQGSKKRAVLIYLLTSVQTPCSLANYTAECKFTNLRWLLSTTTSDF
jgi:hypothetical protein